MRDFDRQWDEREERARWPRDMERGSRDPRQHEGSGYQDWAPQRADLGWPVRGQTGFYGGGYAAAERAGYDMPAFRSFGAGASRAVPGPYSGLGPRNYRRSDERIREDLCEALTEHGHIDATDIDVAVVDGEVTLTGSVADRGQKRLAEDMAEMVAGVRDVHNQLRVRAAASAAQPAATREVLVR